MTTRTYSYTGISFKQNQKAPRLFAFVAPAEDLVEFSGVARKSEKFLTNYQRALNEDRVRTEVAPFFRDPSNCTPTAIVVSLHETPLAELKFEDLTGDEKIGIDLRRLTITLTDPSSLTDDQVIAYAKKLLDQRLLGDPSATENGTAESPNELTASHELPNDTDGSPPSENHSAPETSPSDSDEELDGTEESDGDPDDSTSDAVEIGTSMLRELRTRLENPDGAYELVPMLRDMLKPALIIDGQHRTFGAAAVEENIPLLVCSLVEPEWKEQVFQFTVINDKAQGIPKPFITSLAGMSLTTSELHDLQSRLAQAGVQLWEVDVMQRLGYEERSAFYQLIEFKTTGSGNAGLGYQTMKQIGRVWFEAKSPGLVSIYKMLYQDGSKMSKKAMVSRWQKSEDWFKYFCLFWGKIKGRFGTTPLWTTHSSLLTAVVLLQLQHSFMKSLGNYATLTIDKISEADPTKRAALVEDKFREIVDAWLKNFTEKSFPTKWGVTSLNHKDGKEKLLDYFDKIATGTSVRGHPIITGK